MPLPAELSATLDHPRFRSMRAIRQNFEIDARPTPRRWERYLAALNGARIAEGGGADRIDLLRDAAAGHRAYLKQDMDIPVADSRTPETFDPARNGGALVPAPAEGQTLVRLEIVDWVCDAPRIAANHTLKSKAELMGAMRDFNGADATLKAAAEENLRQFVKAWNDARHKRPMFAAFYDEVREEADADDWLDKLRIRLGLGHIRPRPGKTLAVLQMRYTVKEVLAGPPKSPADAAFAIPTVLDGPVNPCFFAAPPNVPYGRALCLEPDGECRRLTAEVLHRRLDYTVEHIAKFELVESPPPDVHLISRRNEHLNCLRRESGQPDYGFAL